MPCRHALVVEPLDRVVVEQVAATDPGLERGDLVEELAVAQQERVIGVRLAEHEGVADEQLAGQRRVDAVEPDRPAGDDRRARTA